MVNNELIKVDEWMHFNKLIVYKLCEIYILSNGKNIW